MSICWCLSGLHLSVSILVPAAVALTISGLFGSVALLAVCGLLGSVASALVISSVGVVVLGSIGAVRWLRLLLVPAVLS